MFKFFISFVLVQMLCYGAHGETEIANICSDAGECTFKRAKIHYNSEDLDFMQIFHNLGRLWTITPKNNDQGTLALIFKNFSLDGSVYVRVTPRHGKDGEWKTLSAEDGKLEYFADDAVSIKLYAPSFLTGSFDMEYYAGCKFSIMESGDINFPESASDFYATDSCWIVKPILSPDRRRIYFSLSDANFSSGASLKIQDLHSSTLVSEVKSFVDYDMFGADTDGMDTMLVDLQCGGGDMPCALAANTFSLSYYAVTGEQVVCIEIQKDCTLNSTGIPSGLCDMTCSAIDQIVDNEYKKQEVTASRTGLAYSKKVTDNGKESVSSTEKGKGTSSSKAPATTANKKCKNKHYCKCPFHKKYCFTKRKCTRYPIGHCRLVCMYTKVVICPKIVQATPSTVRLLS